MPKQSAILLVDDEPAVLEAMMRGLRGQQVPWDLHSVTGVDLALDLLEQRPLDAVVTDVNMPGRDGLELLHLMQQQERWRHIPVLIVTGLREQRIRRQALEAGATDFLYKPVELVDLRARLQNALRLKASQDALRAANDELELRIRLRTRELEDARIDILWRLAKAAEYRDEQTGQHVVRVACYSRVLAHHLGLSDRFADMLAMTSPLHDVGKIGVPDAILLKPGPLTPDERRVMQKHCEIGAGILLSNPHEPNDGPVSPAACAWPAKAVPNELLQMAASIALYHHEWWNGTGYPLGLAGERIPLAARLVALADVYDALSSDRPYRPALPEEEVARLVGAEANTHLDPRVAQAFGELRDTFRQIRGALADTARSTAAA